MPNRLPKPRKAIAADPIIEARARRTVQNVREHWERRAKANRELARRTPRELAETYGINPHTLRKDRRFAMLYIEKDLEELLSLRRPDGMPLHWGHVIYLGENGMTLVFLYHTVVYRRAAFLTISGG